jgi:hypothetical protein
VNAETAELKTKVERHDRDIRDRPARKLMWTGGIGLVISSILIAAFIALAAEDPSMVYLRESTNPVLLTIGLLSGCAVLTGLILRHATVAAFEASLNEVAAKCVNQLLGEIRAEFAELRERDKQIEAELSALRQVVQTAIVKADAVAFVDARSEVAEGRCGPPASVTHLPVNGRSPSPRKSDHS